MQTSSNPVGHACSDCGTVAPNASQLPVAPIFPIAVESCAVGIFLDFYASVPIEPPFLAKGSSA